MPNQPRILYSFILIEASVTMSLFLHSSVPLLSFPTRRSSDLKKKKKKTALKGI